MSVAAQLSLLSGPASVVAPRLLNAVVSSTHGGDHVAIRITEVEAYEGPNDPGSHARRGATQRNTSMFRGAGYAYVYFCYGMHWCLNVVTGPVGQPGAVLLRAGEVLAGHDVVRQRRPAAPSDRELARGPARLASALGVDRHDDGVMLVGADGCLRLSLGVVRGEEARMGPRVGVAGDGGDGNMFPWRFWIDGEPTVSNYRRAVPRQRAAPRSLVAGTGRDTADCVLSGAIAPPHDFAEERIGERPH